MKIFLKTKTWLLKGSFQSYVPTTRLLTEYLSVSKDRDCNNVCRVRMFRKLEEGTEILLHRPRSDQVHFPPSGGWCVVSNYPLKKPDGYLQGTERGTEPGNQTADFAVGVP